MEELARDLGLVDFALANAKKTDIFFRLFENQESTGTVYTEATINLSTFDRNLPTKFLVHGYTTDEKSVWFAPLKGEYFLKYKCNVIYVDWSAAGSYNYHTCAANSKLIGTYIADFIIASKLNLKMVHLIGHSLGAHIAGFAGKKIIENTERRVGRITGTDPSAARFEGAKADARLDKEDAEFVDVIHTDIGPTGYGYIGALGHADFYVNGGQQQPGCPATHIDDNYNHAISNLYFIESINSKEGFKARLARTWKDYLNEKYLNGEEVIFGENCSHLIRGTFYFCTNSSSPYAL